MAINSQLQKRVYSQAEIKRARLLQKRPQTLQQEEGAREQLQQEVNEAVEQANRLTLDEYANYYQTLKPSIQRYLPDPKPLIAERQAKINIEKQKFEQRLQDLRERRKQLEQQLNRTENSESRKALVKEIAMTDADYNRLFSQRGRIGTEITYSQALSEVARIEARQIAEKRAKEQPKVQEQIRPFDFSGIVQQQGKADTYFIAGKKVRQKEYEKIFVPRTTPQVERDESEYLDITLKPIPRERTIGDTAKDVKDKFQDVLAKTIGIGGTATSTALTKGETALIRTGFREYKPDLYPQRETAQFSVRPYTEQEVSQFSFGGTRGFVDIRQREAQRELTAEAKVVSQQLQEKYNKKIGSVIETSKKSLEKTQANLNKKVQQGTLTQQDAQTILNQSVRQEADKIKLKQQRISKDYEKEIIQTLKVRGEKITAGEQENIKQFAQKQIISQAAVLIPVDFATGSVLGFGSSISNSLRLVLMGTGAVSLGLAAPDVISSIKGDEFGTLAATGIRAGSFIAGGMVGAKLGTSLQQSNMKLAIDRARVKTTSEGISVRQLKAKVKLTPNQETILKGYAERGYALRLIKTKLVAEPPDAKIVPKVEGQFIEVLNQRGQVIQSFRLGEAIIKTPKGKILYSREILQRAKGKIEPNSITTQTETLVRKGTIRGMKITDRIKTTETTELVSRETKQLTKDITFEKLVGKTTIKDVSGKEVLKGDNIYKGYSVKTRGVDLRGDIINLRGSEISAGVSKGVLTKPTALKSINKAFRTLPEPPKIKPVIPPTRTGQVLVKPTLPEPLRMQVYSQIFNKVASQQSAFITQELARGFQPEISKSIFFSAPAITSSLKLQQKTSARELTISEGTQRLLQQPTIQPRTITRPTTKIMQPTASITPQISTTKLKVSPVQIPKPIQEIKIDLLPTPKTPPKNIIIPKIKSPYKPKEKRKKSFNVLVRRFGKFFKVGQALPKGKALRLGTKSARQSLAATFKIEPSVITTAERDDAFIVPRSEFYKKGELFIQRRGKRLSSVQERREIRKARANPKKIIQFF